jgi:hypothetical protein
MAVGGIIRAGKKILGQADQVAKQETSVLDDILDSFPEFAPEAKAAKTAEKDELDKILDTLDQEDQFIEQAKQGSALDDELDLILEEIDLGLPEAPLGGDAFPLLDLSDIMDVEIAKSNIISLTDANPDLVANSIGSEWAIKLNNMLTMDFISQSDAKDFVSYIQKGESLEDFTPAETAAWEKVTDLLDTTPTSGVSSNTSLQPIDMIITPDNPNSPFSFDEMLSDKAYTPEWVFDLDTLDQNALTMMSHIRGGRFAEKGAELKQHAEAMSLSAVNRMYPNFDEIKDMSEFDLTAINFYTRSGDEPMNAALRSDNVQPGSDLEGAIKATSNALDKLPSWSPDDGMLYRRVNDARVRELFQNMEVGQEYTEKAFTSTTRQELFDIEKGEFTNVWGNRLMFVIKPKQGGNGKAIEQLSEFLSESEVLFKPRSSFRIVHKQEVPKTADANEGTVVFVEEI